MKRFWYLVQIFLPFILFQVIRYAATAVLMLAWTAWNFFTGGLDAGFGAYLGTLSSNTEFTQLLSVVFALAVILCFGIWYRHAFVKPLQGRKKKYWSRFSIQAVIALIFLAFGLQYLSQLVTAVVAAIRPDWMTSYETIVENAGYSSVTLLLLLYSVILAPVGEELTFRGLTYRFARRLFPYWFANFLQALLFGIMHGNMIQGIFAFLVGLFLGWVCRTGHSIKYSILLHILFNVLGTLFAAFFTFTEELNAYAAYGAGLALLLFGVLLFRWELKRKNERYAQAGR